MVDIEKVSRDLRYLISFGSVSKQSMIKEIAQDALELLKKQYNLLCKKQKDINKLQADYAELRHKFLEKTKIVRCKECKFATYENGLNDDYKHCLLTGMMHKSTWFCADGGRK